MTSHNKSTSSSSLRVPPEPVRRPHWLRHAFAWALLGTLLVLVEGWIFQSVLTRVVESIRSRGQEDVLLVGYAILVLGAIVTAHITRSSSAHLRFSRILLGALRDGVLLGVLFSTPIVLFLLSSPFFGLSFNLATLLLVVLLSVFGGVFFVVQFYMATWGMQRLRMYAQPVNRVPTVLAVGASIFIGWHLLSVAQHAVSVRQDIMARFSALSEPPGQQTKPAQQGRIGQPLPPKLVQGLYGFDAPPRSITFDSQDRVIATGAFRMYGGTTVRGIARLNSDGSLDRGLQPFSDFEGVSVPWTVNLFSRGEILLGILHSYESPGPYRLVKLQADGAPYSQFQSAGFRTDISGPAVAVLPDGKILIAQGFPLEGSTWRCLLRLNQDGSVDEAFSQALGNAMIADRSSPYCDVRHAEVLPTGQILVQLLKGTHLKLGRTLVRLQSDGSPDSTFDSSAATPLEMFTPTHTGDIFIVRGEMDDSYPRPIFKLRPDGSRDDSFHTPEKLVSNVTALAAQSDGKLLVAGKLSGMFSPGLFRLTREGSLDAMFSSEIEGVIKQILVSRDGSLMVTGNLSTSSKKTSWRKSFLVKLRSDGSPDESFGPRDTAS